MKINFYRRVCKNFSFPYLECNSGQLWSIIFNLFVSVASQLPVRIVIKKEIEHATTFVKFRTLR